MSCLRELRSLGVPFFDEAAKNLLNALLQMRYGVQQLNTQLNLMVKEKADMQKTIQSLVAEKEKLIDMIDSKHLPCVGSAESCINERQAQAGVDSSTSNFATNAHAKSIISSTMVSVSNSSHDQPSHSQKEVAHHPLPSASGAKLGRKCSESHSNPPVFIAVSQEDSHEEPPYQRVSSATLNCCLSLETAGSNTHVSFDNTTRIEDISEVSGNVISGAPEVEHAHSDDSCHSVTIIDDFSEGMDKQDDELLQPVDSYDRVSFVADRCGGVKDVVSAYNSADKVQISPLGSNSDDVTTSFCTASKNFHDPSVSGPLDPIKVSIAPGPIKTMKRSEGYIDCKRPYIQESTNSYERACMCPVCGKMLSRKGNLKMHLLIHTGEKPFRCDYCNAGFVQKGNLKTHMRKHTGEKPYRCEICRMGFAQKGNLQIHTRMHTEGGVYTCATCSSHFSEVETFEEHVKTHLKQTDEEGDAHS